MVYYNTIDHEDLFGTDLYLTRWVFCGNLWAFATRHSPLPRASRVLLLFSQFLIRSVVGVLNDMVWNYRVSRVVLCFEFFDWKSSIRCNENVVPRAVEDISLTIGKGTWLHRARSISWWIDSSNCVTSRSTCNKMNCLCIKSQGCEI